MRILRILAVAAFVLCLILNLWTSAVYRAENNLEGPVLDCPDEVLEISVRDGEEAMKQGLTAWDKQDGDLTDKIMIASTSYFLESGEFRVNYVVFDSHRNSATATRRVRYTDYTSPRFHLSSPLVFVQGGNVRYLDSVTATDVLDGDLTDKIKVRASNISNYTPGTYPVLLEVANSHGDTVQVELSVVVQPRQAGGPKLRLKEYLTYLTVGQAFHPLDLLLSVTEEDGTPGIVGEVSVLGSVDTDQPGTYNLIYSYTGSTGEGRTYLTVVVTDEEK